MHVMTYYETKYSQGELPIDHYKPEVDGIACP